jgi:hypothetical protein
MHMIQVARDAQVRRVGTHERRSKASIYILNNFKANFDQDKVVCNRVDQPLGHYGETWAAYKLAAVMGSLAATNSSAVVAIEGGHGRVCPSQYPMRSTSDTDEIVRRLD